MQNRLRFILCIVLAAALLTGCSDDPSSLARQETFDKNNISPEKAVIEVNEEGSEAAAATVVEMKESAAAEPLTFTADRPFIFVIADDENGTILFLGKLFDV